MKKKSNFFGILPLLLFLVGKKVFIFAFVFEVKLFVVETFYLEMLGVTIISVTCVLVV
jgi:hypothetical protein